MNKVQSDFLNDIKEGKVAEAKANLSSVFASIDSASSKNIIHKNNAANKKARLSRLVQESQRNRSMSNIYR